MKKSRKIENASDENEKKSTGAKTFNHVDQHGQSCVDILESKAMKEGRKAESANDGNNLENAEARTSRHVD